LRGPGIAENLDFQIRPSELSGGFEKAGRHLFRSEKPAFADAVPECIEVATEAGK
jgi:hypothetical protein